MGGIVSALIVWDGHIGRVDRERVGAVGTMVVGLADAAQDWMTEIVG